MNNTVALIVSISISLLVGLVDLIRMAQVNSRVTRLERLLRRYKRSL